jgi:MFS superfamily sulfate permease-like transporter
MRMRHGKVIRMSESFWQRKKPFVYGLLLGFAMYVFLVLLLSGLAIETAVIVGVLLSVALVVFRSTEPSSLERAQSRG